ncbi:MFS transporter [Rhodoluna sp. KAS3]|uniref:MFS transporter n=1 Tax=Rhodoluna sp. KAS3 TaxID=942880 RepID=UPI002231462C|nr:MFS transporter [Rhodoluna sp. KAS3]BDS48432.1 MFS transporter [Rhodoluna sp. KAS3]
MTFAADLSPRATKAWHITVLIYFTIFGLTFSSLMVRLPLVRELVDVTTSELGLILFFGSIGSITSVTLAGRFIARFGTKVAVITGVSIVTAGFVGQVSFIANGSAVGYAVFALVAGLGVGVADVGINVDGAAIEAATGKTALPKMHAGFSIGSLAGAGIGIFATQINFDLFWQIVILSAITMAVPLTTARFLPAGNGIEERKQAKGSKVREPRAAIWKDRRIIFLAIGILGITLAEGASNDWLTIALVDDYQESDANAGIAYAVLLGAMTVTRFFGGNIADRFGKARTLQVLAFGGIIGLLLIIFGGNLYLAWLGALLWGCGVALGFPLYLSAAGEGEDPARKVAFVASSGYLAFLVGPPLLGFLGQAWGVTNMFFVLVAALVVTFIFAAGAGNTKGAGSGH